MATEIKWVPVMATNDSDAINVGKVAGTIGLIILLLGLGGVLLIIG